MKAPSDDPSWWGAHAQVQIKSLGGLLKDVVQRSKTTTDVSEVEALHKAQKKVESIIAIVEAAREHSLDTNGFKDVFDLTVTRLGLEPVVALQMPAHITCARHKFTIRGTEDARRFMQRVSSSEMQDHGFTTIEVDQELLLAERLASIWKMKDSAQVKDCLLEMFDMSATYDLKDRVAEFMVSFTVAFRYEEISTLEERVDLLKEAIVHIDGTIPSSGNAGTPLGSVLATWPKAKQYVEEARAHLTKATLTMKTLPEFSQKIVAFVRVSELCINTGFSCEDAVFKSLSGALTVMHRSFSNDFKD